MSYAVDPADTAVKKPGPSVLVSVIVIILGTVLGITGLAEGIKGAVNDVRGIDTGLTPATLTRHLDTGTWEVFASEPAGIMTPSDVTVTSQSGQQIPTRGLHNSAQSRTNDGREYDGQVEFTISRAGTYQVVVRGDPDVPILLSKSFGDVARHAAKWFVLMAIGILIGFAGIIILIIGIARRRSARRGPPAAGGGYPVAGFAGSGYPGQQQYAQGAAPQQPAVAAGWYPDPSIPGSMRWWDGTRWTDHTQASDQS
jgi:hypothetical protein